MRRMDIHQQKQCEQIFIDSKMDRREDEIKRMFLQNYSYQEMLWTLEDKQGIQITIRTLHRILRNLGLYRRKRKDTINIIFETVAKELRSSKKCLGYRMMHKVLRSKGLTVDRETVRLILKQLDPEGVENRAQHRLHRRLYRSVGPNYTWHLDGYDKIKPFGFPIHACIDGYSRKILWLRVSETNNDPKVTASFYVDCIKETKFVPRLIRTDRGTENVNICGIQRFFRRSHNDSFAGQRSFQYGTSTANQRIEAWWSQLKRGFSHW
uniref:Integrase core domain-containing protein n=1 Tax=Clytia hemisphaerica TaxID=252671 RepID=A0A7M5WYA2_9CNID